MEILGKRHSFHIVLGDSPKTVPRPCLSTKFPHQEIKWNYRILRSEYHVQFYVQHFFWYKFFLYAFLRQGEETWTLLRNHEQNHVLSCLKNMPIYFPSGKYKLSSHSFLEYSYMIVFVCDISCPSKGWQKRAENFFSSELANNFYQRLHL